jgi:predicted methyltransferase MtxX (methanogen marker protein 4)
MVEVQRMTTVADVVAAVREGRLDDFVREAVALVARELMEGEIVRHEALSDRAGCETSPAGCRSSLRKLRAAGSRNRG